MYSISNISNLGDMPEFDFVPIVDKVIVIACRLFQAKPHEIRSQRRTTRVVRARHAVFWALYESTEMSYPEIAKRLNRDHTTVLHGVQRAKSMRHDDDEYRTKTDQLLQQVGTA